MCSAECMLFCGTAWYLPCTVFTKCVLDCVFRYYILPCVCETTATMYCHELGANILLWVESIIVEEQGG